jgi:hypothetical protein
MISDLQTAIKFLLDADNGSYISLMALSTHAIKSKLVDDASIAQAINAAFLIALTGENNKDYTKCINLLGYMAKSKDWGHVARFYQSGLSLIFDEINHVCEYYPDFANNLSNLASIVNRGEKLEQTQNIEELYWSVFFPEGSGILTNPEEHVNQLREYRKVVINELNPKPISDPANEILFTSNVLLTLPGEESSIDHLVLNDEVKEVIRKSVEEPQIYWYDHPIQIGVPIENNEVVYGLRGLTEALEYERHFGKVSRSSRLTCLLSVSVTHPSLGNIAKNYLEAELTRAGGIKHLNLYVFTEADPAANHYLGITDTDGLYKVFGVDGEYGRHYSFLKAISAFWAALIQPMVRGTFKIDLDQVFPQNELLENTSGTAFDHLRTPLWGANGTDVNGQLVNLGVIAGALVNESDISKSIFTPDVHFPERPTAPEQYIFFSKLPQALSTQAEMLARYNTSNLNGRQVCLQRVHVTGGTNGILVDSLKKYRPFTPSFIGRAEDQAYILSTINQPEPKLAYAHEAGLIMRHDKEAFAQTAIQSAHTGTMIGDYVRIIYFSAYARLLSDDIYEIKSSLDPFTGCFISRIPITIAYLHFSINAAQFYLSGKNQQGLEFIKNGSSRIGDAIAFTCGKNSQFIQQYKIERVSWNRYYDILQAIEKALAESDDFALRLREKAQKLTTNSQIQIP